MHRYVQNGASYLIYFPQSDFCSSLHCLCLQIVRMLGSEFTYRRAHSPIKFVFLDHSLCVGCGVCHPQVLFSSSLYK